MHELNNPKTGPFLPLSTLGIADVHAGAYDQRIGILLECHTAYRLAGPNRLGYLRHLSTGENRLGVPGHTKSLSIQV